MSLRILQTTLQDLLSTRKRYSLVQRDHLYSEDTCRIVYEMLVWVYLKYFRAAYSFVILQRHIPEIPTGLCPWKRQL